MCRKCGATTGWNVQTWVPPGKTYEAKKNGLLFAGECVVHECSTCGYAYETEPLDAH